MRRPQEEGEVWEPRPLIHPAWWVAMSLLLACANGLGVWLIAMAYLHTAWGQP